jgi:hypothetical protein
MDLVTASLNGDALPMTGRIPAGGHRQVWVGGTVGMVEQSAPETRVFERWLSGQMSTIQKIYLRTWRERSRPVAPELVTRALRAAGLRVEDCKTLADARQFATDVVSAMRDSSELTNLCFTLLQVPTDKQYGLRVKWRRQGSGGIARTSPYAAHVMTVMIFLSVVRSCKLLEDLDGLNRDALSYLYYLPFCMVFVSDNALLQQCVPLFLQSGQQLVPAARLKDDLTALNKFYLAMAPELRSQGIARFATRPPANESSVVGKLWDDYLPGWHGEDGESIVSAARGNYCFEAPLVGVMDVAMDGSSAATGSGQVRNRKGSWAMFA